MAYRTERRRLPGQVCIAWPLALLAMGLLLGGVPHPGSAGVWTPSMQPPHGRYAGEVRGPNRPSPTPSSASAGATPVPPGPRLEILARFRIGENVVSLSPAVQVVAIIGETLISEDLTCVTVGTLIHQKKLPWLRAGIACFLGIYIGDLTFFFLGRLAGGRLLKHRFFSRALGEQRLREFGEWFDRKPWAAIMACRFLPGIRVPLYVSVGAMTKRTKAFFWWTCFFACIWTPGLIGLVVLMGDAVTKPLQYVFGNGWWTIPLTIVVIFTVVKAVIQVSTAEGRQKIKAWVARRRVSDPSVSDRSPNRDYTKVGPG